MPTIRSPDAPPVPVPADGTAAAASAADGAAAGLPPADASQEDVMDFAEALERKLDEQMAETVVDDDQSVFTKGVSAASFGDATASGALHKVGQGGGVIYCKVPRACPYIYIL